MSALSSHGMTATVTEALTAATSALSLDKTPTRPPLLHQSSSLSTPSGSIHRLLYRGGLSLPDSLLTLDGLTFTAAKDRGLLDNPLALALESMRGRPTLRLLELCSLKDINKKDGPWADEAGDVRLFIHPLAILTQTYFYNAFCVLPFSKSGTSSQAVKIALGDATSSDATEIVIFARQPTALLLTSAGPPTPLELVVARLSPTPPLRPVVGPSTSATRLPRPDDYTPRKPPLRYFGRQGSSPSGDEDQPTEPDAKRRKIGEPPPAPGSVLRRAREVMLGLPASQALARARSASATAAEVSFKVPSVPAKGGKKSAASHDVFGALPNHKGKAAERATSVFSVASVDGDPDTEVVGEVEAANKMTIKRATVRALAQRHITKEHPDHKELFGYVYRGTSFALRDKMKLSLLDDENDSRIIDRIVETHLKMYVDEDYGT